MTSFRCHGVVMKITGLFSYENNWFGAFKNNFRTDRLDLLQANSHVHLQVFGGKTNLLEGMYHKFTTTYMCITTNIVFIKPKC